MNSEEKREVIRKVYSGEGWSLKVDAMPDYQVDAVFDRFVQDGLVPSVSDLYVSRGMSNTVPPVTKTEDKPRWTPYIGEQIKFDI